MGAEEQIQGYFGFDQGDLFANRSGEYTDRQRKKYLISEPAVSWFLLIVGLVFLGLGGWRISVLVRVPESWEAWILPGILVFLGLWLLRSALRKVDYSIQRVEGEASFSTVQRKTGSVTNREIDRYTIESTAMSVGEEVFDPVSPVLEKYMAGKRYAVYYVAATRQVLSVEEL